VSRNVKLAIGMAFLVFVVLLVYSTLRLGEVTVEVCMEFKGRANCGTASAPTEEEAVRTATDNACGLLASGVTETLACSRTPPRSLRRLR
jgi:hypothetical protein